MKEYMQNSLNKENQAFSSFKESIRNEINIKDIERKIKIEGNKSK